MIKNSDISKAAKIDPSKLAPATKEGEVLLSQEQGKFASVKLSGDVTINKDGIVRIKNLDGITKEIQNYRDELDAEAGRQDTITKADLKEGKTLMGGAAGPEEVAVGSGANAIPQRDSSGNLKAETADNADKLDNQDGAYYTNVDNHVYPTQTTTTSNGDETTTTSSAPKVIEFVPNTSNYPCEFSHTFVYIPDVTVFQNNSGTYEMIDAQVTATTSNVTVDVSDPSISTRIVAK